MPIDVTNLVEIFLNRQTEKLGITFIDKGDSHYFISYRDLLQKALGVLYRLQALGLKPGDEVVFQLDHNVDFLKAFWACLLGKLIPVPITLADSDEYRRKLFNIWQVLKKPYLLTSREHAAGLDGFAEANRLPGIYQHMKSRVIAVEDLDGEEGNESRGSIVIPRETDTAFIQFSSGSTGDPKGVVLTHKNLLTNINAILNGFGPPGTGIDRYFNWMPLTHDMGIIGFHLTPLVAGWEQALMSTRLFIRYPDLWMRKMYECKSTLTVSPNFGYKYVLKHFSLAKNQDLDLSAIRIIVNGAEPISPQLCKTFLETMAPLGLKRNVIFPAYGMAEASLAVAVTLPQEEVIEVCLDRKSLGIGKKVKIMDPGDSADLVSFVDVGYPVLDCSVKICDETGHTCEDNIIGEILIGGDNVTSGYYNNPGATSQAITADGWLRTGDLGFFRQGRLVITGRSKEIIFANGQNYYPHDLERVAEGAAGIEFEKIAACGIYNFHLQADEIICFVVFKRSLKDFISLAAALKNHILEKMAVEISRVIPVKKIPKTTSGKIQRAKLKQQYLDGDFAAVLEEIAQLKRESMPPGSYPSPLEIKEIVTGIWCRVLDRERIGEGENFFDIGGTSSAALQVKGKLQEVLARVIDDTAIFKFPTIKELSDFLSVDDSGAKFLADQRERLDSYSKKRSGVRTGLKQYLSGGNREDNGRNGLEIAVIGMSGRFPGAGNIDEFWDNLKNGIESIAFFSDEELSAAGVDTAVLNEQNYIKAKGILADIEYFDTAFFGYTPMEAGKMDPQMRILHECSWEAMENAGWNPGDYRGLIGVYVGASPNLQWEAAALYSPSWRTSASDQFADTQLLDKDFLTTRLSYTLNLTGPSFSLYTACSTSLVAVDLAVQGLLAGGCDMALAGGVSIWLPKINGYRYEDGMLFSRDGHNRTFDEQASGTIFSDGAGILLLKRLEDAFEDGDHIYAVIKGSAVNNDGHRKAGYTAPALEGQAEVIVSALQMAEVEPESIGYLEAHGTATNLGDRIETDALKLAFHTSKTGYCAIGSVKANLGHLNAAAGAVGLIKVVLMLKHQTLVPAVNFHKPNPGIDFDNSPFYVNTGLLEWKKGLYPRRAGVSSFGIGGTNAHVIVEEVPAAQSLEHKVHSPGREYQLILLSAKSESALELMTENAAGYFKKYLAGHRDAVNPWEPVPALTLADAVYTLQTGRKVFPYKRMAIGLLHQVKELSEALAHQPDTTSSAARKVYTHFTETDDTPVIFMFAGLGDQYVNMGRELYEKEPVFQEEMNRCFRILEGLGETGIKDMLYPGSDRSDRSNQSDMSNKSDWSDQSDRSDRSGLSAIAQPVVFSIEYALARLLMSWGIKPKAMIGYSFGEYAAACIAGTFLLEDALKLVVARGRLMKKTPAGAMLSVPLPAAQVKPLLSDELSVAIDNGASCIAAGPTAAIEALEIQMKQQRLLCIRLDTDRAVHSKLMEPILTEFKKAVDNIRLNKPKVPYISDVTGDWLTDQEALDPHYWVRHMRQTVQFSQGLARLVNQKGAVFLEIGPGNALSSQMRQPGDRKNSPLALNMLRAPGEAISDVYYVLHRLGHLWLRGVKIDWHGFHKGEKRQRVPLPTYPFEGQRYWHDSSAPFSITAAREQRLHQKKVDLSGWFYYPSWKISRLPLLNREPSLPPLRVLMFWDDLGLGREVAGQLEKQGHNIISVMPGTTFQRLTDHSYIIDVREPEHYNILLQEVRQGHQMPDGIFHAWGVTGTAGNRSQLRIERVNQALDHGFYSLTFLAKAVAGQGINEDIRILVVTDNLQEVTGEEELQPEKAAVLGACKVIPQEYPNLNCTGIDIVLPPPGSKQRENIVYRLATEFRGRDTRDTDVAYRGNYRWVRTFEPITLQDLGTGGRENPRLRKGGVYLVVGGLGGAGFTLAKYLAAEWQGKLVLTGRTVIPGKEQWSQWLAHHPEHNNVSKKIKMIQQLEALGTDVLAFGVDAADAVRMRTVIAQTRERWGDINGVIYAAGITSGETLCPLNEITRSLCRDQFQAKIYGLMVLTEILGEKPADFYLLMSSLTAVLGGPGNIAYSAANNFLDAFAHHQNQQSPHRWFCVNWDWWQNPDNQDEIITGKRSAITPAQGIESFKRILSLEEGGHLLVSTSDWKSRTDIITESSVWETEIHQARPSLLSSYEAPRIPLHRALVELWEKLLGCKPIGIVDNFFDLGGDSLKAVLMISKVKKEYHANIPIKEFFSGPTVKGLAQSIEKAKDSLFPLVSSQEKKEYYPLSSFQRGLFVLRQLDNEGNCYNVPIIMVLGGELDTKRMEGTFNRLINHHESFRTSFLVLEGEPYQRVYENADLQFAIRYYGYNESSTSGSPVSGPFALPQVPSLFMMEAFDLSRAPLLRVAFTKIAEHSHLFMINIHHIVSDGISIGLFLRDFQQCYQGESLSPLPVQYKDYSQWQDNEKGREWMKRQEAYWLKEFEGEIPELKLPVDFPRLRVKNFEGSQVRFELSPLETEALKKMAKRHEATLFMVLLSLYAIFLAKITGQDDIITGVILAGRKHADLQDVIGMFVNTLPIRHYPRKEKSYAAFLKELKERTLAVFENQDYAFEDLIEHIEVPLDQGRNPLFDAAFSFQTMDIPKIEIQGLSFNIYPYDENPVSKFDMTLVAEESGEKLFFILEYRVKLFKHETIEGFSRFFLKIVSTICKYEQLQPGLNIGDIEILSEEEKKKLLYEFNNTGTDYPKNKVIYELFAEQVEITPDQIALVFRDHQVTYKELNEKSNQLARELRAKGVTAETIVAIMVNHSLEMLFGILAVLKAGGTFMPIDPETPGSRLVSLIEDSPLLLTWSGIFKTHSFTNLQGLREIFSEPFVTPARAHITNLDSLPIPDRSLVDYEKYHKFIGLTMFKHTVSLMSSRGCPYNCAYCHKIWPKNHVTRSANNIFAEVSYYYKLGVRRFAFFDDIFNLDIKNTTEFFRLIIENKMAVQIFFPAGLRGDLLTPEYIDLMIRAGTVNIAMALETPSPRLQKFIGKNLNVERIEKNIKYICEKYPQVILELQLMHGFPTETKDEALMTVNFVKRVKWIHFAYLHILKIYANTPMEKLALENGISQAQINTSASLAYHELPLTLPFDRNITVMCQNDFLNNYFLSRERLLHVLPYQVKLLTEDEIVQKYNSFLPGDINRFDDLLEFIGIRREELGPVDFPPDHQMYVSDLNKKMKSHSPDEEPGLDSFRILLLDLSQFFSGEKPMLYDVVEPPLGLISLLTYLKQEFGTKINGKIAKSRIDFDNYSELRTLVKEFNPHVIGIRTLTFYKDFLHQTAALIRQWGIEAPIILGGPYATSDYKTILQDRHINLVVLGEGEITFSQLVKEMLDNEGKLPGHEKLKTIAGISYIPPGVNPLGRFSREIIMLDHLSDLSRRHSAENLVPVTKPQDLAYIIFTSGSTGKPNGVMIEHKSLVNLCTWHNRYYAVTPRDRATKYAGFGFDASVWEIFPYLIAGASLYIIDDQIKFDLQKLNHYYETNDITISFLPTQIGELFMKSENKSLRNLLVGGDKMRTWYKNNYRVYNNYGPTENTVVATSYLVDNHYDNISIGKPIDNNKVYILNRDNFHLQPVGVPGELCIGGDSLARGYANRPELTAEKFRRIAFPDRLYFTGDMARWLPEGNIEFLGRFSHQIKLRGYRIEPGEIENKLLKYKEINEAVVAVMDDVLCAYIVSPGKFSVSELRGFLSIDFPDYMIPSYFVPLEKIPLTQSGKIDRKSLPKPQKDHTGLDQVYVKPTSELEMNISRIWEEVLQLNEVGIMDNFFNLGGNSLKAFQLKTKLDQTLHRDIPITVLFEHVTIRSFVRHLALPGKEDNKSQSLSDRTEVIAKARQTRANHRHKRKIAN